MTDISDSVVVDVLNQLFKTNDNLKAVGITESQLLTALAIKIERGSKQTVVKHLIEKELELKRVVKNQFGNFIVNTDNLPYIMCDEDSLSDSDGPDTKETDSTTTERTIDSLDIQDSQKSEETPTKCDVRSLDKTDSRSQSPNRLGAGFRLECVSESVDKPILRRKRKTKAEMEYPAEPDTPDRSPSPEVNDKVERRTFTLSKNTGRRVICKKTKYDPSEYYLTPLVRKKKEAIEIPKVKLKRGRPPYKHLLKKSNPVPPKKPEMVKESKPVKRPTEAKETVEPKPEPEKLDEPEIKKECIRGKSSSLKNQCYICIETADVNDKETVFACSLCLNIAHKSCVTNDGFYYELKKWRCEECLKNNPVVCAICDKEYKKNNGIMLMCDFCEEFYHANCHNPPVDVPIIDSTWRCSYCPNLSILDTIIGGREDLKSKVGTYAFCSGTPSQPPVVKMEPEPVDNELPEESKEESENEKIKTSTDIPLTEIKEEPLDEVVEEEYLKDEDIYDEEKIKMIRCHRPNEPIPLVKGWSPKQVADYFTEKFGITVGNAFLSQEIDGSALLLMSRDNVTDELGLHFGIALKVLYYVKKIQLGTNLFHKLWA